MRARGLHPTGDSRRELVERHRARKISEAEWIREVHAALGGIHFQDLLSTTEDRRALGTELAMLGSELQRLMVRAWAERWPATDLTGRIYFLLLERKIQAQKPATPAVAPDWSCW